MATWLVGYTPWLLPARARILNRLDILPSRLWLQARSHLNIALRTPSPASLEIETMPYPTTHPDTCVFEPMSEEYASVAAPDSAHPFTPLSSSDMLASLVLQGDFQAAESLRKEMMAHHTHIPHDALYLRAALHAIAARRHKGSASERLDAFESWLSLVPDRHDEWQSFNIIRQQLFRSMDHLNLTLVHRFGLVLASKGYYSGDAAMQVLSTLSRYAPPSVVLRYLRQVEDASLGYHSKKGTVPPSDLLAGAYSLSIRTLALGGKGRAAVNLVSMAHSRGIRVPDFTLNIVAKHALDRQSAIDCIQALYPSWTMQDTYNPDHIECEAIPTEHSADLVVLAARLRSLRVAMRSPSPPSPHALHSFITAYQALGRVRAITLLRSLAYRHSPKSASVWAFTEMLYYRARQEPMHVLLVFARHFHSVGVPRKTLQSLIRGAQGKQARKEQRVRRWVGAAPSPCPPLKEKLWPSAYHTAIVWDAVVSLSPKVEQERLYALLSSLVRQSRRQDPMGWDADIDVDDDAYLSDLVGRPRRVPKAAPAEAGVDPDRPRMQLPPDTFDAAHFSPFVSLWARRGRPAQAARVLKDMLHLGIEPSVVQWSMVARGYAQHDDPAVVLRILDRLEEMERVGKATGTDNACAWTADALLGIHTNVLRGFVIAGDVQHAREVEQRLVVRLGYRAGDRAATDASIALLRGLEDRLSLVRHEPCHMMEGL